MISFNNIGNDGDLGYQMFQYAMIKSISLKHGYQFCLPPENLFGSLNKNILKNPNNKLYNVFLLSDFEKKTCELFESVTERIGKYDFLLYNECPDNVNFHGLFQSYEYFVDHEEEIRKDFTFKPELVDGCKNFLTDSEYISIHFDDSINSENENFYQEYYERSLHYLPKDVPIIIFCNNGEWVKNQKIFQENRFILAEGDNDGIDLCLMSMCQYHVLSNSPLSWWGAWLSNTKRTISSTSFKKYYNQENYKLKNHIFI